MLAAPEVGGPTGELLTDLVRLFSSPGILFANRPLVNRPGGALFVLLLAHVAAAGISDESRVEILDGLSAGETVVADPYRVFDKLKNGRAAKELTE